MTSTFHLGLIVVGGLGVAAVLASAVMRRLPLSEPLVALVAGLVVGPEVFDVLGVADPVAVLAHVSETVIAIAVMAAALRFDWPTATAARAPVGWALLVVMPAMAVVAGLCAWWVLGVDWRAAVLIGAVVAPTDPVLSASVVSGKPAERALPTRVRAMLSLESGANDGLALPLVVLGTSVVVDRPWSGSIADGLWPVVVGIVLGILIGMVAGTAFAGLDRRHEVEVSARFVFTVVLALFTLGAVEVAGGDGILAVFTAGLAYNRQVGSGVVAAEHEIDEGINRVLVLPVFVLLGTMLPWDAWRASAVATIAFGLAVLALRRLPVTLAARRLLGLDRTEALFVGWFGPIGVAALFYGSEAVVSGADRDLVLAPVMAVVALSTLVHGLTAAPGRRLFERVSGTG